MVRAILSGAKTQTRRVVTPQPIAQDGWFGGGYWQRRAPTLRKPHGEQWSIGAMPEACPYGPVGGRLWVRETHALHPIHGVLGGYVYRADGITNGSHMRWTPAIHMPRAASRITLEITGVRVERLQSISEADAIAEGVQWSDGLKGFHVEDGTHFHAADPRQSYLSLFEAINGPGSVEANAWLWSVEFRRC